MILLRKSIIPIGMVLFEIFIHGVMNKTRSHALARTLELNLNILV